MLENQGDNADDEWWEDENAREELIRLSCAKEDCISDSDALRIESSEKLILAVYKKDEDLLFEQIVKKSFSKKVQNKIAAGIKTKRITVKYTYVIVQAYTKQTVCLKNIKKFETLHMPPVSGFINREASVEKCSGGLHKDMLHAVVFAVDLFQLVEIYDRIGDQLFNNNVRFGINEMLGVDREICKTLKDEPDHFWYKNNGITILAEYNDMRYRSPETIFLDQIEADEEPEFSVINGAQTITASAKYFFELEYECAKTQDASKKKVLEAQSADSKRAMVMVRVICVPKEERALAKEISVALNRQKPIKIEDIVYTTPFVEKLADYLDQGIETGQTSFRIARRGDESLKNQQLELISFVRAVKACMGRPGEARSKSANELLKYNINDEGKYIFQQKDVFPDQWMEAEEEKDTVFQRFYGAAWFAWQISLKYDELRKQLKAEKADILTVIRNGKWYFTAALVQLLNGFSGVKGRAGAKGGDFTAFSYSLEMVESQLTEGIERFAALVEYYVNTSKKYGILDSNIFKKNDCYKDLIQIIERVYDTANIEYIHKDKNLIKYIKEFVSVFSINISKNIADADKASAEASNNKPAAAGSSDSNSIDRLDNAGHGVTGGSAYRYVVLNARRTEVKSMAEAMKITVAYILNHYPQVWDKMDNRSITKWLTKDQEQVNQKDGYFRNGVKTIEIGTDTYWMGTTSNISAKKGQMERLCALAEVNRNEIYWYENSAEPVFQW